MISVSMAISKLLREDSGVTDLLASYNNLPAIFPGRAPDNAASLFPRIEIWSVNKDLRLIGSPLVQVSVRIDENNTGVAEASADQIAIEVLRVLDGYQGVVLDETQGVAVNACAYEQGGQCIVDDGGRLFFPMTFRLQTNRVL